MFCGRSHQSQAANVTAHRWLGLWIKYLVVVTQGQGRGKLEGCQILLGSLGSHVQKTLPG